jgi:hypothetical protein
VDAMVLAATVLSEQAVLPVTATVSSRETQRRIRLQCISMDVVAGVTVAEKP